MHGTFCYLKRDVQTFDLDQVEFVEVQQTDFCNNWRTDEGKFRVINLSFKSGNILKLLVKHNVADEISDWFDRNILKD